MKRSGDCGRLEPMLFCCPRGVYALAFFNSTAIEFPRRTQKWSSGVVEKGKPTRKGLKQVWKVVHDDTLYLRAHSPSAFSFLCFSKVWLVLWRPWRAAVMIAGDPGEKLYDTLRT